MYFRVETLENIAPGITSPTFNKWDVSLGLTKTHLHVRQWKHYINILFNVDKSLEFGHYSFMIYTEKFWKDHEFELKRVFITTLGKSE